MASPDDYQHLARYHRQLASREPLPMVRARLAASADKWEFLARIAASRELAGAAPDAGAA